MPQLLRKKPVEVQAVHWTGNNLDELRAFVGDALEVSNCRCKTHTDEPFEKWGDHGPHPSIKTMEGTMAVVPHAWVVRGVKGEFYPVDPSVFDQTFDIVSDGSETVSTEAGMIEGREPTWQLPAIVYLLNMLSEELVESAKAVNKVIRFGFASKKPGEGVTNLERLCDELNDVHGVVRLLDDELHAGGYDKLSNWVGDPDLIQESIDKRLGNLAKEHDAGRFFLSNPAEA